MYHYVHIAHSIYSWPFIKNICSKVAASYPIEFLIHICEKQDNMFVTFHTNTFSVCNSCLDINLTIPMDTYIIQPFSQVYDLASHTTYIVCALISYMNGGTYS